MLEALLEAAGAPVSRDELLARVWGDEPVSDAALTQAVYLIRRALADGGMANALATLPKRGYRLRVPPAAAPAPAIAARRTPRVTLRAAVALAAVLVLLVAGAAPERSTMPPPLGAEAARLYAIARFRWSTRGHDDVLTSLSLFRRVARLAPRSALGYAGIADAELAMHDYWCSGAACDADLDAARGAAASALRRDPSSAEALTSAAQVAHVADGDDARAALLFRRAIALAPRDALAYEWLGNMEILDGGLADGARDLRAAAALDPLAPATYAWLARAAYFSHDFGAASAYAREALALAPNRVESRALLGVALARAGDVRAAREIFRSLARYGGDALDARLLALALPDARGAPPFVRGENARDAALVWLARGDRRRALAEMRVAAFADVTARRFFAMDPRLDAVRGDGRFGRWTSATRAAHG